MPPSATKPKSPARSSPKSSDGSGSTAERALRAADSTFSQAASLPLADPAASGPGNADTRRRLRGAYAIAISEIRPDPNQPRRRLESVAQQELVESVKGLGILQPVTVRFIEGESVYQIITGERRYFAAREAGLTELPCWVQTPREEEVLLHQIVENWQRLDMHPYDLADALARLRDANDYSQDDLARHTGKSKGEISKLLSILDLNPEVQKLVREDTGVRITRRHLYAVHSLPGERQLVLIQRAREERLAATDLEALVAKEIASLKGQPRRGAPVTYKRFTTSHARVSFTFRKKEITEEDILAALDEIKKQLGE
jgi:ParB family chromosome partitioning protein